MTHLRGALHRPAILPRLIPRKRHSYHMQRTILIISALLLLGFSSACVYQAPLSQGNFVSEEDLEKVEVGMTRSQVRFLLGTPMIDDPFHKNRWDYIYYLRIGREKAQFKRWISVYFEGDTVSFIERERELSPDF